MDRLPDFLEHLNVFSERYKLLDGEMFSLLMQSATERVTRGLQPRQGMEVMYQMGTELLKQAFELAGSALK